MQASATTETINGPSIPTEPANHNHKPNFGRYVAGCPRCQEIHPNGPPPKKSRAKKSEATGMTKDEMIAFLREQAPQVAANTPLEQLVQLMLNKEAKVIQKENEEAKRKEAARQDMIRMTAEQEAVRIAAQNACGHVKENGRTAIVGQVHNDGLYHPFCQRCMKTFPPRRPNQEQLSRAVQTV